MSNPVGMSSDHPQSAERPAGSAEAPFLELLARGASADAYEQPVLIARAEGRPTERIAALEAAKAVALRVRSELEGRRRREGERCLFWMPERGVRADCAARADRG